MHTRGEVRGATSCSRILILFKGFDVHIEIVVAKIISK